MVSNIMVLYRETAHKSELILSYSCCRYCKRHMGVAAVEREVAETLDMSNLGITSK